MLTDITTIAARGIPGAEATSITLLRDDKAFTAAYSGDMALAADELQYEHGLRPLHGRRPRWRPAPRRRHGTETALAGLRRPRARRDAGAQLAVGPAALPGLPIGALNNYSTQPAAFASPESLRAGPDVAEVDRRRGGERRRARAAVRPGPQHAHRDGVPGGHRAGQGRAHGAAARDAEQAFEILREASQRYNRKLRDIAAGIVECAPSGPARASG